MAVDKLLTDGVDSLIFKDDKTVHVDDPDDCECCGDAECPSDCSGCDDPITATVTGVDGGSVSCFPAGSKDCSNVNQVYSLTRSGCTWTGTGATDSDYIGTISCLPGSPDSWRFDVSCTIGGQALWTATAGACPPATGWSRLSSQCTNGAVTMS